MARPIETTFWGPTWIGAKRKSGQVHPVLYRGRREIHQARQKCLRLQRTGVPASLIRIDRERVAIRVYCPPRCGQCRDDMVD